MIFRLLTLLAAWFLLDGYGFNVLKTLEYSSMPEFWQNALRMSYWLVDALFVLLLVNEVFKIRVNKGPRPRSFQLVGVFLLIFIPKLFLGLMMLGEDVFRFGLGSIDFMVAGNWDWAQRSATYSFTALGLAFIPFAGVLHGMTRGKYRFKVKNLDLNLTELPPSFDGFKIVQISDIHSGSFDSAEAVKRGIKKINALKPDLIVFTGDLVNHHYSEAEPWVDIFAALEAPYGKISVLGNHDYPLTYFNKGDESRWNHHLQQIESLHERMGFQLLRNESTTINKGEEKIYVSGVENWGLPPFPQLGDLNSTSAGVKPGSVNILLSHDPSHWDAEVKDFGLKYHLTLSGHTHGMQFGFEWGKYKWSPVKYKYPKWAGHYSENDRHLYVNRGFGFIGFSGRVGIYPEITLITLNKSN